MYEWFLGWVVGTLWSIDGRLADAIVLLSLFIVGWLIGRKIG